MMLKNPFVLILIIILLKEVSSKGRSKKSKSLKLQNYSHQYDIYQSDWLPSDVQITTYLYKDVPKTFLYWSPASSKSLSAIVMTCSALINWSIFFEGNNNSTKTDFSINNYTETTKDITIKYFISTQGLYLLKAISREGNTYVHIYISTENEGPQALKNARQDSLKILKRGKNEGLIIRWEPSLVDPQRTDYCLAINTKNHYKTMCSAEAEILNKRQISWEHKSGLTKISGDMNPSIQCVGQKTHLKISKPKPKEFYYFDLFAINKQSNLTYLLDWTYKKFDVGNKFISIKDGKFASLRKMGEKAIFRFKVGRKSGKSLNICVIPCGSSVYVDIRLNKNTVVPQSRVDKFKNITIPNVIKGQRYIIKVIAPRDDFANTGVEILAITRPSVKSPIPTMPQNTTVKEYESLKTCNSVTLGWMPSLGQKSATYCFIVKEGKIKENEGYSQPNQCGLENRLKKSLDFVLNTCRIIDHKNQSVITNEIKRLKPGRNYIVLVSVKNPKGRSVSYNVLQVNTLNYCSNNFRVSE